MFSIDYINNDLKENNKLVYIDIGANDGVTISNSLHLEINGWDGICIEPLSTIADKLRKNRKCTIHECACTNNDGIVKFTACSEHTEMLSGISEDYNPLHVNRIDSEIKTFGGSKTEIDVKASRLQPLIEDFFIKRGNLTEKYHVNFLSIDTEGNKLKVLQSIDFTKSRFDLMTIETNYREEDEKIKIFLAENKYAFIGRLGGDDLYIEDSVFVSERFKALLPK